MSNADSNEKKIPNVPNLRFPCFSELWRTFKLKNISLIYDGTHQTPDYKKNGIKFVSVEDINDLYGSKKYISENAFKKEFKNKPVLNDVLMTRIGDIGTPAIVSCAEPLAYYVSLALIKPTNIDHLFLKYLIESRSFQHELWKRTIHVAFPKKINKEEIGECLCTIPEKDEQVKIGVLMSKIDERIETQNKIIEELKTSIKAILDDFFTNKSNSKVGNYITEISLRNKSNVGYPVFSVSNKKGFIPQNEQFEDKVIASDDKSSYKIVSKNTFAYNPARINVGSIGLYEHDSPCIVSPMYNCFNVLEIEPTYLLMYFKSSFFINEMNKRLEGSVRMCLTMDGLKNLPIYIPSTDEMHKVISIYLSINRKLQNSMKLLDLYLKQKEYLLSNLFI